jgi:hypothetical protein
MFKTASAERELKRTRIIFDNSWTLMAIYGAPSEARSANPSKQRFINDSINVH